MTASVQPPPPAIVPYFVPCLKLVGTSLPISCFSYSYKKTQQKFKLIAI